MRTRRRLHEVTTFRKDVQTDGRHAVVEYGASLDEDLARRDFTINAIAYHPLTHEWRDPFFGAVDLTARIVRAVGEPAERFREDFLRILRALRFAARFGFDIEPRTWDAARELAPGLDRLSAERVREEWFKGLRTARSLPRLLELWLGSGAAAVWLPELLADPPTSPTPDVSSTGSPLVRRLQTVGRLPERAGAIAALSAPGSADLPRDPVLLTALLCVDPVSVLVRLKASNAEIARAAAMVTGPLEPEGNTEVGVRRWMAAVGDAAEDLSALWRLRRGALAPWADEMHGIRARGEPLSRKQLAVTGEDLREAGIPPGPGMGLLLDQLLALVVDDPSRNTREQLLAQARRLT